MHLVPLFENHGPHPLTIPPLCEDASIIAADGAVSADRRYASWAIVRGDGHCRFGWYVAGRVSNNGAELEAVRQAATLGKGHRTILNDCKAAGRVAVHLAAGGDPDSVPDSGFFAAELFESAVRDLSRRPFTLQIVTAVPPEAAILPRDHALMVTVDHLAWTVLNLAVDEIAITAGVRRWLAEFVTRGPHRDRRRNAYRKWSAQRREREASQRRRERAAS